MCLSKPMPSTVPATIHRVPAAELGLSYRHSAASAEWIFTRRGIAQAGAATRSRSRRRMADIQAAREASQPIRARTGGSTFANPPGHQAWQLIDAAGCRGLVRGGAMVSEKHTNFLINTGTASAADIEGLGEEVRRRVHAQFGIVLEWEIRRVGRPLPGSARGGRGHAQAERVPRLPGRAAGGRRVICGAWRSGWAPVALIAGIGAGAVLSGWSPGSGFRGMT